MHTVHRIAAKNELENPVHIELNNTITDPLVILYITKNSYIMTWKIPD